MFARGGGRSCSALPERCEERSTGLLGAVPMADDIDWLDLPGRWTYGVCGDGRIFFIK